MENAFSILAKKWRLYDRQLETKAETSKIFVKATSILKIDILILFTTTKGDVYYVYKEK